MAHFEHQRHKPLTELDHPRELLLVCSPLRSKVNFSRIIRTASCCGVKRVITTGRPRLDPKIARVEQGDMEIENRRSLLPVLSKLHADGYQLVGLEQTSGSECLHGFEFVRRTALVVGNERQGIRDELLSQLERVVEIPVYGMPYSYNVATSVAMALYEYCRQFPSG
jgi:tRNA G18 (ribose-2'-O)-methylase SpoU